MMAILSTVRYVALGNTLSVITLMSRFPKFTSASTATLATSTWMVPKNVKGTPDSLHHLESARQNVRQPRPTGSGPKTRCTLLARPMGGPCRITTTLPIERREVHEINHRLRKGQRPTTEIPPHSLPCPENEPAPPWPRTVRRNPYIPPLLASTPVTTDRKSVV